MPWHGELYAAILGEQREAPHSALGVASGKTWSGRKRIQQHPAAAEMLALFLTRLLEVTGTKEWELSAWANVTSKGGACGEHDHLAKGNAWSGVYYLTGGAPIIFHAPRLTITPEPGLLIVFPASERHSVAVQVQGAPRVSIAMNAAAI
jgi:hypothetical protein